MNIYDYDVVIIGGGHAGCEAAAAAAHIGAHCLLITHKKQTIGAMSCNPAIGGIGKGHLVREIDALDGVMAKAADEAGLHFRLLNRSKGPAVHGPRAQTDRALYRKAIYRFLSALSNLTIKEGAVEDLSIKKGQVTSVRLDDGQIYRTRQVVLTTGTFLRGVIHIGKTQYSAGRYGCAPSIGLARRLYEMGFSMARLKTGTPPRLDGRTIDWSLTQKQKSDTSPEPLSFLTPSLNQSMMDCHIIATNERTHQVILDNLASSPIYSGQISSSGPRYCPSIEDKVKRFASAKQHQIFLEPEGREDITIYPNGISTALPQSIQRAF